MCFLVDLIVCYVFFWPLPQFSRCNRRNLDADNRSTVAKRQVLADNSTKLCMYTYQISKKTQTSTKGSDV